MSPWPQGVERRPPEVAGGGRRAGAPAEMADPEPYGHRFRDVQGAAVLPGRIWELHQTARSSSSERFAAATAAAQLGRATACMRSEVAACLISPVTFTSLRSLPTVPFRPQILCVRRLVLAPDVVSPKLATDR